MLENRIIGVLILRVLIGLLILKDFVTFYRNQKFLFNNQAIVSYETYEDIIKYYNLDFLYVDFNNSVNVFIFCVLGFFFSFLFVLGVFTRISAFCVFILLFIFKFRNIYLMDGGDNVITAILPLFLFVKSKSLMKGYEVLRDRFGLNNNFYVNKMHNIFVLGIMIQICIVYFFAGLHKLQGEVWLNGTALYYILNSADFSAYTINEYITKSSVMVTFLTWFTILFQLMFPVLVWFSKTKKMMLILGILLHLGIFLFMRIDNFSYVMLACYAVFFTDSEFRFFKTKIKKNVRV